MQLILKREDVPYVLRPTKGYEDLCEIAVEEMAKEEVLSLAFSSFLFHSLIVCRGRPERCSSSTAGRWSTSVDCWS